MACCGLFSLVYLSSSPMEIMVDRFRGFGPPRGTILHFSVAGSGRHGLGCCLDWPGLFFLRLSCFYLYLFFEDVLPSGSHLLAFSLIVKTSMLPPFYLVCWVPNQLVFASLWDARPLPLPHRAYPATLRGGFFPQETYFPFF